MRVVIKPDYEAMSRWAAAYVAAKIIEHQKVSNRAFVLGLPTGSTPLGFYRELVRLQRSGVVDLGGIVTFNMDEYVGIDANHPQSYAAFMRENFFGPAGLDPKQTNLLDGCAEDLEAECKSYEARMAEVGGIDLFLGGIGADGHIAFNEPGSSLSSRTRLKTLTEETRLANSRFFHNDLSQVPRQALTVGVGTIMDAREVLILASGLGKARALQKVVEDGVNHLWTVSALQMHPKGIVACTDDATMELKVGTVKYFKDIESGAPDIERILANVL